REGTRVRHGARRPAGPVDGTTGVSRRWPAGGGDQPGREHRSDAHSRDPHGDRNDTGTATGASPDTGSAPGVAVAWASTNVATGGCTVWSWRGTTASTPRDTAAAAPASQRGGRRRRFRAGGSEAPSPERRIRSITPNGG